MASRAASFREEDGCVFFHLLVHKTDITLESEFYGPATPEHIKAYPKEYKEFVEDKAVRFEAMLELRVKEEIDKLRTPEDVVKAEMIEAAETIVD